MLKSSERWLWVGAGVAAVAAVGGIAYAMSKPSTASAATTPRTASALDNYQLAITSTTPLPQMTASSYLPTLQALPGLSGASITNVTQSADLKTATVAFTAPPAAGPVAQAALSAVPASSGLSYVLTDTGVAVQ